MKNVLILGGSGYIGKRLFAHLGSERAAATYNATAFSEGVFFDALETPLSALPFDLGEFSHAVILFGVTSPDFCFNEPARSDAINVTSIKSLIDDLAEYGIKPVFASTEVVFDGRKGGYVETDEANPILVYGQQKLTIERYLESIHDDFLILRIAKAYDSMPVGGSLLGDWFVQMTKGGEIVRCARDFISSAIHVDDLAKSVVLLMERGCSGTYHLGGPTPVSRLEIFETLLEEMKAAKGVVEVEVVACSIHDFATAEPRPLDVSMRTEKVVQATGMTFRNVTSSCRDLVKAAQA